MSFHTSMCIYNLFGVARADSRLFLDTNKYAWSVHLWPHSHENERSENGSLKTAQSEYSRRCEKGFDADMVEENEGPPLIVQL